MVTTQTQIAEPTTPTPSTPLLALITTRSQVMVTIGTLLIMLTSFYGKAIAQESIHKKALKYSKSLKAGKKAFQQKDYVRAQQHFRHHLRRYKKDYDSWNYLAATYYHLGLPKKSLRYLKYIYKKNQNEIFQFTLPWFVFKNFEKSPLPPSRCSSVPLVFMTNTAS